jgi:pimeloyl-ACP methyl ester carboxylesterase
MPTLLLILCFSLLALTAAAQPSRAVGTWTGTIAAGGGIGVVLHVAERGGALATTLDVPVQGAIGLPTGETTLDGDVLTVTIPSIGARFEGTLVEDGGAVEGTWQQGGASLPLRLTRAGSEEPAAPQRPQHPTGDGPYREEVVQVDAGQGVVLEGTLTLPLGDGPFRAVVLVSGSGPQDRDATVFGHRLFAVWADALARRGVASLRYDERGVGASSGSFDRATTADFAADAQAAAEQIAARSDVGVVGIVGHSEGGLVAPIAARASGSVGFVVTLAGPAEPFRDILRFQLLRDLPAADTAAARPHIERALDAAAAGDADATAAALGAAFGANIPAERAQSLADFLAGPWGRYALNHDAEAALAAVGVPALAVYGGRDQQVPAATNAPAAAAALAQSPSPRFQVAVLADKNHLFQTAPTGAPAEYAQIEETVSPDVLNLVAQWVLTVASEAR